MHYFEPSSDMLKAFTAGFTNQSLAATSSEFDNYLKSRVLNKDNIVKVLKTLLSIEDITEMQLYANLMHSNYVKYDENSRQYFINLKIDSIRNKAKDILIPYMDEVVLVSKESAISDPLPTDRILCLTPHEFETLLCKPETNHRHVGKITSVKHNQICFNLCERKDDDDDQIQDHRSEIQDQPRKSTHRMLYPRDVLNVEFTVIFRSPRIPFILKYNALNILAKCRNTLQYIFPKSNLDVLNHHDSPPITNTLHVDALFNGSIATNPEQLLAIRQIIAGPDLRAPYIVFGPPGTGKTTTIVEAILQLYVNHSDSCILVTSGSNSACDTIALRICEVIASENFLNLAEKPENWKSKFEFTRIYSKSYNKPIDPKLKEFFRCIRPAEKDRYLEVLEDCKIIVATLCGVGQLYYLTEIDYFSHIFIDEAAASMEVESLMGIAGVRQSSCHVILSGDHKQLGPVVKSKRAQSLGLGESLMERLLLNELYKVDDDGNYDTRRQVRLRRNYRSHPEIVGIYNHLYYNNQLIPLAPLEKVNQATNWSLLPKGEFPILFKATYGTTERERYSTSSFNVMEAEVVHWFVERLLEDGLGNDIKVQPDEIGIITPYLAQCKHLKRMLHPGVEVGSVESYQGREKPIIIVSLVTSFKNPHFLSNPRRVNVFLSRAKQLMILIGNPDTLSENEDFQYIINKCKQHGNYLKDLEMLKKNTLFESCRYRYTKTVLQNSMVQQEKENDSQASSSSSASSMGYLEKKLKDLDIWKISPHTRNDMVPQENEDDSQIWKVKTHR